MIAGNLVLCVDNSLMIHVHTKKNTRGTYIPQINTRSIKVNLIMIGEYIMCTVKNLKMQ